MRMNLLAATAGLVLMANAALVSVANAQAPTPELDACKASGLIALRERRPAIKEITIDPDTASVSKTDLMVEQTRVKTVVLGLATIDTAHKEKPNQFVCLIGDKGKVLLTFFTQK